MSQERCGVLDLQGIKTDLASAFPLGQINLWRPAVGSIEPERGPGTLSNGCHEVGLEVETAAFLNCELLLRVYCSTVVRQLAVARLWPSVVRLELQVGVVNNADLCLRHQCGTVVRVAPWVIVVEIGFKSLGGAEAGVWDEGGRSFLQLTLVEWAGGRGSSEAGQEGDEEARDHHGGYLEKPP